jgi:hypothetical protein
MMSLRLLIAVCIIFGCTCMNGCTKSGSIGPQGAQGPAGTVGPAGASGTVIYSGTTAPDPSVGNAGDFYLDLSTDVLFGPKNASGWGTGFAMKGTTGATGAAGAAGAPGSQVYSGSGVPAATLGKTGDYYLDKTNYVLYGPKVTSGWGLPITLQGPAGTANVEYTPWITPVNGYGNTNTFQIWTYVTLPALSQTIIDQGTVFVYSDMEGYPPLEWSPNYATPLPATVPTPTSTDYWSYNFQPQTVRIIVFDTTNTFTFDQLYATHFRIVLVPGGVSIPSGTGFDELLRYMRTRAAN